MQDKEPNLDQIAFIVLKSVKNLNVGKYKLAQFLKGSKSKDVQWITNEVGYGKLYLYDISTIIGFIEQIEVIELIKRKVISEYPYDYSIFEITNAGEKVLEDSIQVALPIIKEKKPIIVGNSEKETLRLLQEGKSIFEIAKERNLVESTIFTHIFRLIINHYISSKDVISKNVIKQIFSITKNYPNIPSVKEVKELLPHISYEEIRCVLADMNSEEQNELD